MRGDRAECSHRRERHRYLSDLPTGWGDIGAVRSVGSKGDSYDNAAAESVNNIYKKELIDRDSPSSGAKAVAFAIMEWVAWYNKRAAPFCLRLYSSERIRGKLLHPARGAGSITVFGK